MNINENQLYLLEQHRKLLGQHLLGHLQGSKLTVNP